MHQSPAVTLCLTCVIQALCSLRCARASPQLGTPDCSSRQRGTDRSTTACLPSQARRRRRQQVGEDMQQLHAPLVTDTLPMHRAGQPTRRGVQHVESKHQCGWQRSTWATELPNRPLEALPRRPLQARKSIREHNSRRAGRSLMQWLQVTRTAAAAAGRWAQWHLPTGVSPAAL